MSPIANWTSDDVWEYIGQYKNGQSKGFTDGVAVWEMYADAGATGTCAIVADMATEGLKKSRACGARFGCAMCAAVGRDKSLENMLMQPQYSWMRNLNRIQRFIVDTQWDWGRRNWIGRSISKGFIKIQPDTYSPAMMQELLRYCLTADVIEYRAALAKGIAPRFQLVTEEQLLAIDALWSLNGLQERPFTAVKIWDEVYNKGMRFYPPEVDPVPRSTKPTARYIYVGPNWDGGTLQAYTGLRSALYDLAGDEFGGSGCMGRRALDDGREVMDVAAATSFGFDPEAMSLFFGFEMEYAIDNFYENPYSRCTAGFFHYVGLNMIQTSEGHVKTHVDRIMRRTAWRLRNGLVGELSQEVLESKSISKAEMLAELAQLPSGAVPGDMLDADEVLDSEDGDVLDLSTIGGPVAQELPVSKTQQLTFEFA
jgi:DNA sulfur modification protein DndC